MNLILTGCEWAGKRTLGNLIAKWWCEQTGEDYYPPPGGHFHDHFTVPHVVHIDDKNHPHRGQSEKDILKLNPGLLEHFQRYQIEYHFSRGFVNSGDHWTIDWYYGDAVYAPFYWGYGRPGEYADRREMRKHHDKDVMEVMPDCILVLVKSAPDAIRQRMRDGESAYPDRHAATMFRAKDAGYILGRFQEEFENSLILQRFSIDTTDATPEESLQEFVAKVGPYLTQRDRAQMKGE